MGRPQRTIPRGLGSQSEFADVERNMYQQILVKIFVECTFIEGMLPNQGLVQFENLFQILMSACHSTLQNGGKLLIIHARFLPS